MLLSDRLVQLLQERKTTMYALSKAIGVHQTSIKNWIAGTSHPNSDMLKRIADYFMVSTDYLLGRTDNPSLIDEIAATHSKDDIDFSDLSEEDQAAVRGVIAALRAKHRK